MVKAKKIELTQEELKEVLHYSEDTGLFRWRVYRSWNAQVGDVAGTPNGNIYWKISYRKQRYYLHRLAWLYVYGEFPEDKFIDHIDGDKSNNRISNLRLCTKAENKRNVRIQSNNSSGYKGVYWHKKAGKWMVQAVVDGEVHYLGLYVNKEEAIVAYKMFCELHHGEFYRDTTRKD